MATIFRRKLKTKTTYIVQVRRVGFKTIVKTFNTRTDAIKWSRNMERNLDRGISTDFTEASRVMIKDLLKRYLKNISIRISLSTKIRIFFLKINY